MSGSKERNSLLRRVVLMVGITGFMFGCGHSYMYDIHHYTNPNSFSDSTINSGVDRPCPFSAFEFKRNGKILYQWDFQGDGPTPVEFRDTWYKAAWDVNGDTLKIFVGDKLFPLEGFPGKDTLFQIDYWSYPSSIYVKKTN